MPAQSIYASTRAISAAVVADTPMAEKALAETTDAATETSLEREASTLAERLARVDPNLIRPFKGMHEALASGGSDWVRHFSTSVRELLGHLLDRVAPEAAVSAHFTPLLPNLSAEEQRSLRQNGQWTRRAGLSYVCRNIADGDFKKMAGGMIDITLALFFPANDGVHTLAPPITELQARAMLHQAEASMQIILTVAGY